GTETWQTAREVAGLFSGVSAPLPPAFTAPSSNEYTAPEHGPLQPVGYIGPVALTLCLCLIGGIVTIVYTSQVNEAAARGDAEAYTRLKSTRQGWIIASLIIGLLTTGIQVAYYIADA
ncbi:MAG: CD225/dispanin family protein, partial [Phycisphaerales bacterium]|nr:CD225/dispanin family protein [Phycisphaerales bacterium]